jgi:hypothetical protein
MIPVMGTVSIPQIDERLRQLPADKLAVVYDFVTYLLERSAEGARATMLASEEVLRQDWDLPEEDEAWADL